jgi:two-component system CheB/CheR fusion protein
MAPAFRPDVVLLDIGLPGLDGYQVAQRLRQNAATKGVSIIGISGYGQAQDRERSQQAGFDHHLVKPVEFTHLIGLLNRRERPQPDPSL